MTHLSVCTPTYNRPEKLLRTLRVVLPQLTAACDYTIIDNCSDTNIEAFLRAELSPNELQRLRVVRNVANIGLVGNILRCFELEGDGWLWILSDDDEVFPDAIATVLDLITRHGDCAYINTTSGMLSRTEEIRGCGLKEYVAAIELWSHRVFVSTCLYNLPLVRPHLRLGYLYGYGIAPFIPLEIEAMKAGHSFCLSPRQVVSYVNAPQDEAWSRVWWSNTMLMAELIPQDDVQKEFLRKVRHVLPGPIGVTEVVAKRRLATGDRLRLFFYLRSMLTGLGGIRRLDAPGFAVFGFLLRWPKLCLWLIATARKLVGKTENIHSSADIYKRI